MYSFLLLFHLTNVYYKEMTFLVTPVKPPLSPLAYLIFSIAPISPNLETFAISEPNNTRQTMQHKLPFEKFLEEFCAIESGPRSTHIHSQLPPPRFLSPRTKRFDACLFFCFQSHTIYKKDYLVLTPLGSKRRTSRLRFVHNSDSETTRLSKQRLPIPLYFSSFNLFPLISRN